MTSLRQSITILGSTGSIGTSTLDVIARHPDRYRVFALTAATQVEMLLQQCQAFSPRYAVMASAPHATQLAGRVKELGLPAYTEKLDSDQGVRTRVRAGPFATREAAEKAQAKIKKIGVAGTVAAQ
jgi:1-deoxy-D-xylulose 5-phosphate reductoisomerase